MDVNLSTRSHKLIKTYTQQNYSDAKLLELWSESVSVNESELIEWLTKQITIDNDVNNAKQAHMLLSVLHTQLLHDLHRAINPVVKDEEHVVLNEGNSWSTQTKFALLLGAGVLLSACDGFDNITMLLSMFTSIQLNFILLVGIVFSTLAVVIFCGLNLVNIATNLGMGLADVPQHPDILLLQMQELKAIRRFIKKSYLSGDSDENLDRFHRILAMLKAKHTELVSASNEMKQALNGTKVRIATLLFTGFTSLMFFCSGFFAGQSVALFMLGLVLTTATPTALPVILFSLLVGGAAFTVCWSVERAGLKKLISGWFGLDEDKIVQLCDENSIACEKEKLDLITKSITNTMRSRDQSKAADDHEDRTETAVNDTPKQAIPVVNRYSFYHTLAHEDKDDSANQTSHVSVNLALGQVS
ncbi:MAG: hypothetical protein ACRC0B_02310 [Legionella sp.]